jgi:protein-S-isoprenylcysteine O-methyltransferase Ste14
MYAALIGYILSLTLLLDSIWALIPAGMVILVYLIRTHLEDRMQ